VLQDARTNKELNKKSDFIGDYLVVGC
jgi:hypothetical protein